MIDFEFARRRFAERPAGCGQDMSRADTSSESSDSDLNAAVQALKDRVVLAIDRQDLHTSLSRCVHHDLASHDQDLFARDRQIFSRLDRRQRRSKSASSDDGHQHHLGIVERRDLDQPSSPEKICGLYSSASRSSLDLRFVHQTNRFRPDCIRLRRQFFRVAVCRETDDFHPLRNIVRHFQRAFADRSGRAENDNAFRCFDLDEWTKFHGMKPAGNLVHANDEPEIKKKQRRGEEQAVDQIERAANSRQRFPESFTPVLRLTIDSARSPMTAANPSSNPSTVACVQFSTERWTGIKLEHAPARQERKDERARRNLPRFSSG